MRYFGQLYTLCLLHWLFGMPGSGLNRYEQNQGNNLWDRGSHAGRDGQDARPRLEGHRSEGVQREMLRPTYADLEREVEHQDLLCRRL